MSMQLANPADVDDLRRLPRYEENPLLDISEIVFKDKKVKVGNLGPLASMQTGEQVATAAIFTSRAYDEEPFIKTYAEGVRKSHELKPPGYKMLQVILHCYHSQPGWNQDQLYLHAQDAIKSPVMPVTEKTYQRGLKELIQKQFIAATSRPGWYWINPHLFFKGDRVVFINECVRKKP